MNRTTVSRGLKSPWLSLFLFVLVSAPSGAIYGDPAPFEPHGAMFFGPDVRSFRRPQLFENQSTGKVDFPITVKDPVSQQFFNQAVGALFGYWHYEAERAFREVEFREGGHPMASWGLTMVSVFFHGIGADITRKRISDTLALLKAAKNLSRLELGYLNALYALHQTNQAGKENSERFTDRLSQFAVEIKKITTEFPNDLAAKTFRIYALTQAALLARNPGARLGLEQVHPDVDPLFKEIFKIDPNYSGALHQSIHRYDDVGAGSRAVNAAKACGQSAPEIAHMWHMPAHAYESKPVLKAWHTQAALRKDHRYFEREGVMPFEIHNYFHDGQFLISSLENAGEFETAIEVAKGLIREPQHPRFSRLNNSDYVRYLKTALIHVLEINEAWEKVLELSGSVYLPYQKADPKSLRYLVPDDLAVLRLTGIAHARLDHDKEYEAIQLRFNDELRRIEKTLGPEHRDGFIGPLWPISTKEQKRIADFKRLRAEITSIVSELAVHQVIGSKLEGAERRRKLEDALEVLIRKNSRTFLPVYELAQFYLELDETEVASRLLSQSITNRHHSLPMLARMLDILSRNPKKVDETKLWIKLFYGKTSRRDGNGGRIWAKVKKIADQLKIDVGAIKQTDILPFEAPALDSFGPLSWRPVPARISAKDPNPLAGELAKSDRGTLVFFRQKVSCEHCNQQLKRLDKMIDRFIASGTRVIVVSNDTDANLTPLKNTYKKITFISDTTENTFRWWGAYDEFFSQRDLIKDKDAEAALHGTFFVNKLGEVIWKDIARIPFDEFEFLAGETHRLANIWMPVPAKAAP